MTLIDSQLWPPHTNIPGLISGSSEPDMSNHLVDLEISPSLLSLLGLLQLLNL